MMSFPLVRCPNVIKVVFRGSDVAWTEDLFIVQQRSRWIEELSHFEAVFHCFPCAEWIYNYATLVLHCHSSCHIKKADQTATPHSFDLDPHLHQTVTPRSFHCGLGWQIQSDQSDTPTEMATPDLTLYQGQDVEESKPSRRSPLQPNSRTLADMLRSEPDYPILGLEFVEEIWSDKRSLEPLYECNLSGCNSTWGDAKNMKNHLIGGGKKPKHARNYLLNVMGVIGVSFMDRNKVLEEASRCDWKLRDGQERNYDVIKSTIDNKRYFEIRGRHGKRNTKSQLMVKIEPEKEGNETRADSMEEIRNAELMIEKLNLMSIRIEENLQKINRDGKRSLIDVTIQAFDQLKHCLKVFCIRHAATLVQKDFDDIVGSLPMIQREMAKI